MRPAGTTALPQIDTCSATAPSSPGAPGKKICPSERKPSGDDVSRSRWRAVWGGIGLLSLLNVFVATHGTFSFDRNQLLPHIFPAMWRSLAQGRFDIDPAAVGDEAFHRNGLTYSYYGIFPALLRGLATLVDAANWRGLPLVSVAVAATVCTGSFLVVGVRLATERPASHPHLKQSFALYLLTLALASPITIGLSLASVFNEAALWGCAWACVFNAALLLFAEAPAGTRTADNALLCMSIAAPLALLSRATAGVAALFELGVFGLWAMRAKDAWIVERRWPLLRAALVCLALCSFAGYVNAERWGNPFEFRPMKSYGPFENKERGRLALEAGTFRIDRVPSSALYYFLPCRDCLLDDWPPLRLVAPAQLERPPYDYVEDGLPLTVFAPAFLLFALTGMLLGRWERPIAGRDRAAAILGATALLMGGMLLTFDTLAVRFLLDLVPALAGLGLLAVIPRKDPPGRFWLATLVPLLVWSILATHVTATLLRHHRVRVRTMSELETPLEWEHGGKGNLLRGERQWAKLSG